MATADLGGADDTAYDLAPGANGSIVLGGGSNGEFAFARFLKDGHLDAFFGQHGLALYALGTAGGNVISGVAVAADGRIVAAGDGGGKVAVLRLTADGSEDNSFGSGGVMTVSGLAVRTDLGCRTTPSAWPCSRTGGSSWTAARPAATSGWSGSTPTARPTGTFGKGGLATVDFGGDDDADAVLVQGSGEILAIGTTNAGGTLQTAVAAFGRDGSLDTSFADQGKFTVDSGLTDASRALHVGDLLLRAFGSAGPTARSSSARATRPPTPSPAPACAG